MTPKLIAFDLDGTLLDDSKRIPPENLLALEEAAKRGCVLAPATGRIYAGVPEEIRRLPYIRYYILVNGARVYDSGTGQILYRGEIPPELALRALAYMDTLPVLYDCYQDDRGWMSRRMWERLEPCFALEPEMLDFVRRSRQPVEDLIETIRQRGKPVQKLQMHFRPEQMALRERVRESFPSLFPELTASSSLRNNLEINSVHAGKGRALLALCERLGIPPAECAAFGDGGNDRDMLLAAGLGVAMANAAPEVKAAADRIAPGNNEAGVAQALRELLKV